MKYKVLIVDDAHLNIRVLTDILINANFDVVSTDTSLNIPNLAIKESPDVILLDIVMPDVSGFEVCKLLKSHESLCNIPVIMVTADTNSYSIKKALHLGAFDYVKKPFEEIEIIARIRSALKLKEYQDQLRCLALTDGLTKLYNRAAFMQLFEKEMTRQSRTDSSMSFVMIDVDDFKVINDSYGHLAGDFVLKELSKILTNSVRCTDLVSRFGGDEFSIILTEINKEDSFKVCDRIRERVESHVFHFNKNNIRITLSIGVLCVESLENLSRDKIISLADKELYLAKKQNKNSVRIA